MIGLCAKVARERVSCTTFHFSARHDNATRAAVAHQNRPIDQPSTARNPPASFEKYVL